MCRRSVMWGPRELGGRAVTYQIPASQLASAPVDAADVRWEGMRYLLS